VRNDFSINQRRVNVILRGAKACSRWATRPWSGNSGAASALPAGRHADDWPRARPRRPVALTGHQMAGLKTATGSGLLLAQLMTGETPRFDPEPFRADRY